MKYCITMERTQRVAVWFDAGNDDEAVEIANGIYNKAKCNNDMFNNGDIEYDYALASSDGCSILDWEY